MTNSNSVIGGGSFSIVSVLAIFVGSIVVGYGLLIVPSSVLGGVWIGAIGLSVALSGAFATDWAGNRFGLSATARRRLPVAFAVLAVVLLVSFVAINSATFESEAIESAV